MEGPVEDGAGGGGGLAELRRGEEAAANGDETVRRGRATLVPELLVAGLKVPAGDAAINGGR